MEPEIHPKHRPLRHECITLIPAIYGWEQIEREYLGPCPTPGRPSPAAQPAQPAQVRGAPGIDPGFRQSDETKQGKSQTTEAGAPHDWQHGSLTPEVTAEPDQRAMLDISYPSASSLREDGTLSSIGGSIPTHPTAQHTQGPDIRTRKAQRI